MRDKVAPKMDQPLVSIVTPCLNSASFLERAIESVLAQDYPRIEYLVMDGGSTDESLSILDRYQGRLEYSSAPDKGPADAVNKGFARSKGSVLAWINADDEYLPGAVSTAVQHLVARPDIDLLYGEAYWIDAKGDRIGRYPTATPYRDGMLAQECGICQPTVFLRRAAFFECQGLKTDQNSCWDYDLWIRMSRRNRFLAIPEVLAYSRMHRNTITLAGRRMVFRQNIQLLLREYEYVPLNWVYGYLSYLHDRRDQFFEPLRHSAWVYLGSLFAGTVYNYRHPWRYWKEWASRLRIERVLPSILECGKKEP